MQTLKAPQTPDDLIRPSKAAQLLGVHVNTVLRWVATGRVRGWTVGPRGYRVSKAEVQAQLKPVALKPAPKARVLTPREERQCAEWAAEVLKKNGID